MKARNFVSPPVKRSKPSVGMCCACTLTFQTPLCPKAIGNHIAIHSYLLTEIKFPAALCLACSLADSKALERRNPFSYKKNCHKYCQHLVQDHDAHFFP